MGLCTSQWKESLVGWLECLLQVVEKNKKKFNKVSQRRRGDRRAESCLGKSLGEFPSRGESPVSRITGKLGISCTIS